MPQFVIESDVSLYTADEGVLSRSRSRDLYFFCSDERRFSLVRCVRRYAFRYVANYKERRKALASDERNVFVRWRNRAEGAVSFAFILIKLNTVFLVEVRIGVCTRHECESNTSKLLSPHAVLIHHIHTFYSPQESAGKPP